LGGWFNPTAMLRPLQPMHSATVNESEGLWFAKWQQPIKKGSWVRYSHHPDLSPNFAFLHTMLQDAKMDISKGFDKVNLDTKLIEPKQ
jgi:hypothetical protein